MNNYWEGMLYEDYWVEYLHYGRVLSGEERNVLHELFMKIMNRAMPLEEAQEIRVKLGIRLVGE